MRIKPNALFLLFFSFIHAVDARKGGFMVVIIFNDDGSINPVSYLIWAAIFFVCAGCAVVGIQKDESGETRVARMSRRMSTTGRSSTAETPGAGNDTKLFNGKDATEMAC